MTEQAAPASRPAVEAGAQARTKALVLVILTGLGSRVLILAAPLLTIPVTLHYLGPDLFGFWMTIVSITAMAMFADLGLGNGLLTRLAACAANRDFSAAKTLISTAYISLAGVALVLMAFVMLIVPSLDWAAFLNLDDGFEPAAIQTVAALCLSAFAVTIPLSLVQRVQYAFGDAWKSNVWQVFGAVFTVVAVYAAASSDAGYGLVIAAAVFSSPFVMFLNNLFYYARHAEVRPGLRSVSVPAAGSLLRVGLGFLLLSVLTSLSLNIDNLIVANVADVSVVSDFSITTKLFSLLAMAITLVALPLWPANGEALARGDSAWVQKTTRKMVLFSVALVGIGGGMLIVSRDFIAGLWIGEGHTVSWALAFNLVLWSMLLAFSAPFFSVQNSVGLLRYQFIGWALFLAFSIPLKVYFYSLLGLPGIPLAGAVAYLTLLSPAALIGYRVTLRGVDGTAKN
jgi:O-antigen/teichoic acid export membrane protein